jgi:hypothetical protein
LSGKTPRETVAFFFVPRSGEGEVALDGISLQMMRVVVIFLLFVAFSQEPMGEGGRRSAGM